MTDDEYWFYLLIGILSFILLSFTICLAAFRRRCKATRNSRRGDGIDLPEGGSVEPLSATELLTDNASKVAVEFSSGDDVLATGGVYKGQEGKVLKPADKGGYLIVELAGNRRIVPRKLLQRRDETEFQVPSVPPEYQVPTAPEPAAPKRKVVKKRVTKKT